MPQIFRGKTMRIFAGAVALLFTLPAFAGASLSTFMVPTLDELGLVGLIAFVGIAAGLVMRRRKK
jgi:ABC-type iron transport system FetAB permease component